MTQEKDESSNMGLVSPPIEDPTKFIERLFACVWNEGHSVRLINRDNPRWAISIRWDEISALRHLLSSPRPVAEQPNPITQGGASASALAQDVPDLSLASEPKCVCFAGPSREHSTYCPRKGMDYDPLPAPSKIWIEQQTADGYCRSSWFTEEPRPFPGYKRLKYVHTSESSSASPEVAAIKDRQADGYESERDELTNGEQKHIGIAQFIGGTFEEEQDNE